MKAVFQTSQSNRTQVGPHAGWSVGSWCCSSRSDRLLWLYRARVWVPGLLQSWAMAPLSQAAGSRSGPSFSLSLNPKWACKRPQEHRWRDLLPGVGPGTSLSPTTHIPDAVAFWGGDFPGSQDTGVDGVLRAARCPPPALPFCGQRLPLRTEGWVEKEGDRRDPACTSLAQRLTCLSWCELGRLSTPLQPPASSSVRCAGRLPGR